MYVPIFYVQPVNTGGYFLDKGFLREQNPDAPFIYRRFTYDAVQAFYFVNEALGKSDKEKAIIDFSNVWGALFYGDYDHRKEFVKDKERVIGFPPEGIIEQVVIQIEKNYSPFAQMIHQKLVFDEYEGRIVPHIRPYNLAVAIALGAKFRPAKLKYTTCKYYLLKGNKRNRASGDCPVGCQIDSKGGKKEWGDGCKDYYKAMERAAKKAQKLY